MASIDNDRKVHQPIHPSVRPLLDPEYVAFHDKYVQYIEPDDTKSWDGSARTTQHWPSTGSSLTPVGKVSHHKPGRCTMRVFTPKGPKPEQGWPVFVWFFGGGWAVGSVAAGNDFCTLACETAKCVTIAVGYRLAPEHPYPAAVEDAVETLEWVRSEAGAQDLEIDASRIAIGGTSAGGNLAAALSMKAAQLSPPISLAIQLLVLPVIDNTATVSTVWASRSNAPWLTPARMSWYRNMYLPDPSAALNWDASPNLAPQTMLATCPKTWIAVAEQDLLAAEAMAFANQLRGAWSQAGVNDRSVEVRVYEGMPHSTLAMSGTYLTPTRLELGRLADRKQEFCQREHS